MYPVPTLNLWVASEVALHVGKERRVWDGSTACETHSAALSDLPRAALIWDTLIEQNAKDIRKLLDRKDGDGDEIRTLVNKNRENIEQLDSNIKTIDQEVREFRG